MKFLKSLLMIAILLGVARAEEKPAAAEEGFTPLFDGKTFTGWKIAEKPESFVIEDGSIVAKGSRAHAFCTGEFHGAKFKNFELRIDVMTKPNSNGGIFIGSEFQETGWPAKGYEIQVNNTHKDWRKTGGLYSIVDNKEPFEDEKWMAYVIRVENGKITSTVNGKVLVDAYTPPEDKNKMVAEGGAIALQAHDPDSVVFYKNIRIKPLD